MITTSCHDGLTASDLAGRYQVKGGETAWIDGSLAATVRSGAICYLDEIVEAHKAVVWMKTPVRVYCPCRQTH